MSLPMQPVVISDDAAGDRNLFHSQELDPG